MKKEKVNINEWMYEKNKWEVTEANKIYAWITIHQNISDRCIQIVN